MKFKINVGGLNNFIIINTFMKGSPVLKVILTAWFQSASILRTKKFPNMFHLCWLVLVQRPLLLIEQSRKKNLMQRYVDHFSNSWRRTKIVFKLRYISRTILYHVEVVLNLQTLLTKHRKRVSIIFVGCDKSCFFSIAMLLMIRKWRFFKMLLYLWHLSFY